MCILSVASLHSCRQRSEVKPQATQNSIVAIPDIQRIGTAVDLSKSDWVNTADKGTGFLIVKNDSVLRSLAVSLRNKTPEERKAWAAQYGFLSMQQVYETAAQAGEKQQEFLQKFPNALRQDPQAGLLPNIHDYDLAHLVNPDGLIMVAGHLFQYSRQQVKRMDGKKGVKPELLKQKQQSDRTLGIEVATVKDLFAGGDVGIQRTGPFFMDQVKDINFGVVGPWDPFVDKATAWYRLEATETSYFIYGNNPIMICNEFCSPIDLAQRGALQATESENVTNSLGGEPCICYYYYPIIGANFETRLNTIFRSERVRSILHVTYWVELWGAQHTKTINGAYTVNGTPISISVGPLNDSGNIILSLPLDPSGNTVFISNQANGCDIIGSITYTNFYSGALGPGPQDRETILTANF